MSSTPAQPAATQSEPRDKLVRRAIGLAWFTVVYNLLEGIVSIGFGIEEASIALFGFGSDSLIEVASAGLVLWRFRGEEALGEGPSLARERRATLGIGVLFMLLATGVAVGAIAQLVSGGHPSTTLPGIIIALLSLSFMAWLWRAKLRLANALDSATVRSDANCSLACLKLSLVLLAGSLLYAAVPSLFWADAAAALVLAVLIGREGLETIRHARAESFTGGCGCAE